MAALGDCFGCIYRRPTFSAQDILSNRHRLEVGGIDAGRNAAKMVNGEAQRNSADPMFIREAVSHDFSVLATENSVTVRSALFQPQPTPRIGFSFVFPFETFPAQGIGVTAHLLSP